MAESTASATTHPYLVLDSRRDLVDSTEDLEDALTLLRTLPRAHTVERDGVVLAFRPTPKLLSIHRGAA